MKDESETQSPFLPCLVWHVSSDRCLDTFPKRDLGLAIGEMGYRQLIR
jgi:hypothetical protein